MGPSKSQRRDISELVGAGADLEKAEDERAAFPIHWAARGGHAAVVRFLVEAGADIQSRMALGETPLVMAAHGGNVEIVRFLLEAGAKDSKFPVISAAIFTRIKTRAGLMYRV